MFTQLSTLMKATWYYAIAFGLAVVVALFGERLGEISQIVSMFTPLAAVLLVLLVVTRDGYSVEGWKILGFHRLGLQRWPLAIFGPLLVLGSTYVIVWVTGIGHLDMSNFPTISQLLSGLVIGTIYAMAEEIGWRGYLLPNLETMGRTRALLVSGLLHGVYHLPLMLLTPFYHDGGNRWIVVGLFLLTLTGAGVIYGYLRLTSESVWPAAVAHNTFNTIWQTFMTITVAGASPILLEYLAGESGILTLVGVWIMAAWMIKRLNRQDQQHQPASVKTLLPATN